MKETELIKLAQEGDKKALAKLVKIYEQTVYNFSYKLCRDKERAEHTMQETFLSMVKNLMQFKGDSKLSTWLFRVVSNNCLMLARSENKHKINLVDEENEESSLSADYSSSPAVRMEENEMKELLDEAIGKLQPEYRAVFVLRDVEGLTTDETAEVMNLSVPAVKSRLLRARAFLRDELNGKLNYENI